MAGLSLVGDLTDYSQRSYEDNFLTLTIDELEEFLNRMK